MLALFPVTISKCVHLFFDRSLSQTPQLQGIIPSSKMIALSFIAAKQSPKRAYEEKDQPIYARLQPDSTFRRGNVSRGKFAKTCTKSKSQPLWEDRLETLTNVTSLAIF